MPHSGQFYPYQYFLTPDPTRYFQDNIQRFIPAMYTTGEFEGTLALFQTVIAPLLDEMYQRYIELPQLSDVDRCPPKFLQLLAGNINVLTVEDTFDESQTVPFRRRELGKMVDIFKLRGVPNSFLRILKYQGGTDYGLIVPRENLMLLDLTPISGTPPHERNDVGEPLAPQYFDISVLADGGYDNEGNLVGSRISYALPVPVIRSDVKLFWNDHEVPLQHEHPDGLLERSFFFDRANSTLTTNFVPLIGDKVVVEVVGDPRYLQTYRMADRMYWRPGTEEVYSDQNPLLRVDALEDRRPVGTLLYFAWLAKFFWTKCFPHPPTIDSNRRGYAPLLPPHLAMTWNWQMECNSPDPWFFQFSNGYGYEAVWEARSSYQMSRQYPFEASMRESAPKSLALNQQEGAIVGTIRLGLCQTILFSGIPITAEIVYHTHIFMSDMTLRLVVDANGNASIEFLSPTPEEEPIHFGFYWWVTSHHRFSFWHSTSSFPTGGTIGTHNTPFIEPGNISIYFSWFCGAIPLSAGPLTDSSPYAPGQEIVLLAQNFGSSFNSNWNCASSDYGSKYSGPANRNSDNNCYFEITKWVEGNTIGFTKVMPATTMPWTYVNGGLNNDFQYGTAQDGTAPLSISSADGIDFTPGKNIRVTYVLGQIRSSGAASYHDANGELPDLNPGYFDPATFPIRLVMLVGAFVDNTGQIVDQPFGIGDGPVTRTIPNGATALQLGFFQATSAAQGNLTVEIASNTPFTPGPPVTPPIYGLRQPHRRTFRFQQRQEP